MATVTKDLDIIDIHAKEVKRISLIDKNEEADLARKAKAGDKAARNRLIEGNMRFVIKIAKQYLYRGLEYEDLISEGYLGLIEAIDKFDVDKGYHFLSYAVWWIRQSILKAIYEKVRPIRLPANRNNELLQIEKELHSLKEDENRSEDDDISEVAEKLGMTKFHVREILNISRDMVSLNKAISPENNFELIDTVASNYKDPAEEAMEDSLRTEIDKVLDRMDDKSANVIRMRYGLGNTETKSLQDIGKIYDLSKERIRQIEKKTLNLLKTPEYSSRLEMFVA